VLDLILTVAVFITEPASFLTETVNVPFRAFSTMLPRTDCKLTVCCDWTLNDEDVYASYPALEIVIMYEPGSASNVNCPILSDVCVSTNSSPGYLFKTTVAPVTICPESSWTIPLIVPFVSNMIIFSPVARDVGCRSLSSLSYESILR